MDIIGINKAILKVSSRETIAINITDKYDLFLRPAGKNDLNFKILVVIPAVFAFAILSPSATPPASYPHASLALGTAAPGS